MNVKKDLNSGVFNWVIVIFIIGLIGYLGGSGIATKEGILASIGGILMNVAAWIVIVFGLEYFQLGLGKDIKDEIYTDKNIAASIYEVGIKIGLAIVIAKGIM